MRHQRRPHAQQLRLLQVGQQRRQRLQYAHDQRGPQQLRLLALRLLRHQLRVGAAQHGVQLLRQLRWQRERRGVGVVPRQDAARHVQHAQVRVQLLRERLRLRHEARRRGRLAAVERLGVHAAGGVDVVHHLLLGVALGRGRLHRLELLVERVHLRERGGEARVLQDLRGVAEDGGAVLQRGCGEAGAEQLEAQRPVLLLREGDDLLEEGGAAAELLLRDGQELGCG